MSFRIYVVGYIILIIGLAIGAHLLHVPQKCIAIIDGVRAIRQKDPSS